SAILGGGICNQSTLLVSASLLSGNAAIPGYSLPGYGNDGGLFHGVGGGIYNRGDYFVYGRATVSNSTLSGNSANFGGGIANYGSLTVSGSSLLSNSAVQASDGIGGVGGGLHNYGKATFQSSAVGFNR